MISVLQVFMTIMKLYAVLVCVVCRREDRTSRTSKLTTLQRVMLSNFLLRRRSNSMDRKRIRKIALRSVFTLCNDRRNMYPTRFTLTLVLSKDNASRPCVSKRVILTPVLEKEEK